MPVFKFPINDNGPPIVTVLVGRPGHRPPTSAVALQGLLDTGAQTSAIDLHTARTLRLPVAKDGDGLAKNPDVVSPGSSPGETAPVYAASLMLLFDKDHEKNLCVDSLEVAGFDLAGRGYDVLIGRDIFARCCFSYDGLSGWFSVEY
jgi:hypothetical protein